MTTATNYWDGGTYKTLATSEAYDGWLMVIQKVDTGGGQVNTSYDAMGRVQSTTNPFPQGGTPGPATTVQYDALGRRTIKTLPDNNTVQKAYNGNLVTMTDEVNRKTQQQTDGLGRLTILNEQDASGALTQSTTYGYDYLDDLTFVNQGTQARSFKYDALKRLLYERIPEQNATINDGTGTFWSSKYTYTDFDNVLMRTDARGVVTTYSYDGLNRVTSVSYNTSNAPAVSTTSTVIYTYGTGTQLKSVGACNEFYEGYAYDQYNRVATIDRFVQGRHYQSSYQYNQINQRTQSSDPGGILSLQYDNQARLTAVGSYLTGTTYNASGQVTSFNLGNGVAENLGYDANRMQLITFNATAPGGPFGGLMQLSYVYQASAGQSGAGTTAGNAGQLTSMFGTVGGIPEGASYSYDLQERLATSYTGTNNQSAYRRYEYDRWGNRTGVWDAVSGGNQIQSVALEMSGGVPTNRIQSVTAGGTVNYLYDAAGNVINDGLHSYTYDAENRLVSVDGGATAQYLYDYKNRRVLKQVGTAKTDYVWDENRVVEEHDGTSSNAGVLQVKYIYSGSDMIAKVDSGVTRYVLRDRLSIRVTLDANRAVIGRQGHLPFGEDFAESGSQDKHHFTGYERDPESALDYATNRIYAPLTAKLSQTDPYKASAYAGNPQSWNQYTYVLSDPVNKIDPLGLRPEPPPDGDCADMVPPQLQGPGYAQAYKLVGPAYDKSGTKVVGWRYTPTCESFLCGPRGDRIEKKKRGPFLQCLGGTIIIPFPPSILCLGACFGKVTPGFCDGKPF